MTQILGAFTYYLGQYFVVGMVWLVGIILSISYWRRHPKVSLLTLIAIAIFLIESLASSYATLYVPLMLRDQGWTNHQLATHYFPVKAIIASLLQAAAWGFILAAIFAQRDKP